MFYCSFYVCFLVLHDFLVIMCVLCFCIVSCIVSSLLYSCLFSICVQVYWPLPPGGHPISFNKRPIMYHITHFAHGVPFAFSRVETVIYVTNPVIASCQNSREPKSDILSSPPRPDGFWAPTNSFPKYIGSFFPADKAESAWKKPLTCV